MKGLLYFLVFAPIWVFAQASTNSSGSGIFTNFGIWTSPRDLSGTANILNSHTVTIPAGNTVYADKITFTGTGKLALTGSTSKWVPANSMNASPQNVSLNLETNWYAPFVWAGDRFNAAHYTPWLDSVQGWSASDNTGKNHTDYLQYDLKSPQWVQGIVTQGRANGYQWVTSAKVDVSIDGTNFVSAASNLTLNTDYYTKVYRNFPKVMFARYVRVTPLSEYVHPTMRLGILLRDYHLRSCNEILTKFPGSATGVYQIDPDGSAGASPITTCYCDMDTDGGGWTLVLNYLHLGGTNPALSEKTSSLPLIGSTTLGVDEQGNATTWGHTTPAYLNLFPFTELRFYGKSSLHNRIIHFKTSHSATISYFKTGTGSMSGITSSFTLLTGHSANLPASSNLYFSNDGNTAMSNFPFYLGAANHWGIRGLGSRWEVDDYPNNSANSTYHQIWIR